MVKEGTFFEEDETWDELGAALERGTPVTVNPPVTEWQWRVGTSYNVHVYALHPTAERDEKGRSDEDVPVFSALGCPAQAALVADHIVYAHNRLLRQFGPGSDDQFDALQETAVPKHEEQKEG